MHFLSLTLEKCLTITIKNIPLADAAIDIKYLIILYPILSFPKTHNFTHQLISETFKQKTLLPKLILTQFASFRIEIC